MFTLFSSIISAGVKMFTARSERKAEANRLKTNLLASQASHNHNWEIAALEGEGFEVKAIRLIAFLEVTLGTAISVYDPEQGAALWASLAMVPAWVIGLKVTIFGWAFGSTPIKHAAALRLC